MKNHQNLGSSITIISIFIFFMVDYGYSDPINNYGFSPDISNKHHEYVFKEKTNHEDGVYITARGDRYEGEFNDNEYNGHGVYLTACGDRYEGEFKGNEYNGHGVYITARGDRYEGEFKNNIFMVHPVNAYDFGWPFTVSLYLYSFITTIIGK